MDAEIVELRRAVALDPESHVPDGNGAVADPERPRTVHQHGEFLTGPDATIRLALLFGLDLVLRRRR